MKITTASKLLLCVALASGCAASGGAPSGTGGAIGTLPALSAGAPSARAVAHGSGARRMAVPVCRGAGTNSFVGGHDSNVAKGTDAGVLSGYSNQACDARSAIGAGGENAISSVSNTATDSFIGAGTSNVITGAGADSFIGAGFSNLVEQPNSAIGGGTQNTNNGSDSAIGGGAFNGIGTGFVLNAGDDVIGGGASNVINSHYDAIGGGQSNIIFPNDAFIGGGANNTIGATNTTEGTGGVIGGGWKNTVLGQDAVVGGGFHNQANGLYATVPGGAGNVATGAVSFAGGVNSLAANAGAFVWSDYATGATQLKSTLNNQFLARGSGGFTFYTNASNTTGATLAAGSGSWASLSDRAMKTDVAAVDDAAVLEKLSTLPITRWSYISEHGVRHIGPMAQDFYKAFGLGEDNRHITTIDEEGVAYASIRALQASLHATNGELARRAAALREAHRQDETTLAALHQRVAALKVQLRDVGALKMQLRKLKAEITALH